MKRLFVFRVEIQKAKEREVHFYEASSLIFGRSDEAQVICDHRGVSRQHILVTFQGNQLFIQDLGTSNGTKMNGISLKAQSRTPYMEDDSIQLGTCEDTFHISLLRNHIDPDEEAAEIIERGRHEAERIIHEAESKGNDLILSAEQESEAKRRTILQDLDRQQKELLAKHETTKKTLEKEIENDRLRYDREREQRRAENLKRIEEEKQTLERTLEERKQARVQDIKLELERFYREEFAKTKARLLADAERDLIAYRDEQQQNIRNQCEAIYSQAKKKVKEDYEAALRHGHDEAEKIKRKAEVDAETLMRAAREEVAQFSEKTWSELQEKTEVARAQIAFYETEIKTLQAKSAHERTEHESRLAAQTQEFESLISEKTAAINHLAEEMRASEREKHGLLQELLGLQENRDEFSSIVDALQTRRADLEQDILTLQEAAALTQAEHEKLGQALKQAQHQEQQLQVTVSHLESLNADLQTRQTQLSEQVAKLQSYYEEEKAKRLVEIEEELSKLKSQVAREIGERRKKIYESLKVKERTFEQRLAAQKLKELESVKAEVERQQRDWIETIQSQLTTCSTRLLNHLQSELPHILADESPQNRLNKFESESQRILREVFLGVNDAYLDESKELLKPNFERHKKVKQWWRRMAMTAAAVLLFAVTFPTQKRLFIEWFKEKRENAQTNSGAQALIKEIEAKRAERYIPKTTPDFKETYTKNVLYTTDFSETVLSQKYQDEWILAANTFFVKELGLSDNTIVSFIAQEVNLVKKLAEIRSTIRPDSIQAGLDEMVQVEDRVTTQMKITLEGERRFNKFKTFSKKFYEDYVARHNSGTESMSSESPTQ